jgi:hypothetical protein
MLIVSDNQKIYEKPASGAYLGVIADTVDLGIVSTKFGNKMRVRIVWLLGKPDGSGYAVDSEGNPFRVMSELNATVNEKSDLFKLIRGVLGAPPPAGPYDIEQLIGKSNQLFVVLEKNADGTKEYANVKGILPLPAGISPLAIPATFVRHKDKKDNRGTPAQQAAAPATPATPAAAPPAAPVAAKADVSLDKTF